MKRPGFFLALAAAACAHSQTEVPCSANLAGAALAMPRIIALADPPPAVLEAGFVLCSPHRDRLLAASSALGAEGYSSYIGTAAKGSCLRVARTHEAGAPALQREITTMCRIAESHQIAYRHWQAEVGGKSLRLAGDRLTVDGEARRID